MILSVYAELLGEQIINVILSADRVNACMTLFSLLLPIPSPGFRANVIHISASIGSSLTQARAIALSECKDGLLSPGDLQRVKDGMCGHISGFTGIETTKQIYIYKQNIRNDRR
jgi:hypothetical protein